MVIHSCFCYSLWCINQWSTWWIIFYLISCLKWSRCYCDTHSSQINPCLFHIIVLQVIWACEGRSKRRKFRTLSLDECITSMDNSVGWCISIYPSREMSFPHRYRHAIFPQADCSEWFHKIHELTAQRSDSTVAWCIFNIREHRCIKLYNRYK